MIIGIIGGGAAGFFSALSAKKQFPHAKVIIFEKAAKVLGKVKVSGGGRCNVTNATFETKLLAANYPRGENFLRKAFEQFNTQSTIDWFEKRKVALKTFPDGCIFPVSNDSQTIIDCFLKEATQLGVEVKLQMPILSIELKETKFVLYGREQEFTVDRVIVTTGGQPKLEQLNWLAELGHEIIPPVPSLFTFNMPENPIRELMGNVVEEACVKIEGSKLIGKGPLLVTHWGMSGPAILQLSAWGARLLETKKYQFAVLVNWLNETKEEGLRQQIQVVQAEHGAKMIGNLNPFPMTNRLWNFLLEKSGIQATTRWKEIGTKSCNKLVNTLLNDRYEVTGKTTFKEEFVTAGGVSLTEINVKSMESRKVKGLFFAGEIMDIDGITGGFNFQAAWTTGFIAGKNVGND
jgi:predicted Rossmann fold flavoprotein